MSKKRRFHKKQKSEFDQKLLDLARVTRVVSGGRRFRFRATLVIGNRKGKVGVGVAKGKDVSLAIQKAFNAAKKNLIRVNVDTGTIPHDIRVKLGSAKVILKPAPEGRGVVAGGPVRAVVELAGIKNIITKSLGTNNKLNVARVAIKALTELKNPEDKIEKSERKKVKKVVKKVNKDSKVSEIKK